MLKQVYELFISVVTLTQRLERQEQRLQEQQRELKELTAFVQRLAYEIQRTNDAVSRVSEREESERRILKLEVENQLLRAERGLLAAKPEPLTPPEADDQKDDK